MDRSAVKQIAANRKAYHDYFVEEKFEAGLELCGTEVKSIRQGTLNLKEAWCNIKNGELWVQQMHISPYEKGNLFNKDPMRPRKLLMHRKQIMQLLGKVKGRIFPDPAQRLFPRATGQAGAGAVQGQKTLR